MRMNKADKADGVCRQIQQLIDAGDFESAARLSGEELAKADAAWAKEKNAGNRDASTTCFDNVLKVGVLHCDALFHADDFADAYSAAVMLMLQTTVDNPRIQKQHTPALTALCTVALSSLQVLVKQSAPDTFIMQHLPVLLRYLGSLALHYAHSNIGVVANDDQWLLRAMMHIRDLHAMDMLDEGDVNVNGTAVSVWTPGDIMGDIFARSRALGFIEF